MICLWVFLFCIAYAEAAPKKSICLNMIVKDETPVIRRCLESVKPLIDYWVIVDTGSTDGTQEMILSCMQDIPGELHERPWVNFAKNRNEALELAKHKGDFLFFIDADEELVLEKDFVLPELDKDLYHTTVQFGDIEYARASLINNSLDWKWFGVVHEYLDSPECINKGSLKGLQTVVHTDGHRSQDPLKYVKDARLLESALQEEPDNHRYMFYLAQSYKDAKEFASALEAYEKRAAMGGWDEEVFCSMLQVALLQDFIGYDDKTILESHLKAHLFRPSRIEPLYYIAHFHRMQEDYLAGYETAKKGLPIQKSDDLLFVEKWIYSYGLLLDFSICAYWTGHYTEALLASRLILANEKIPSPVRECVERNLEWIMLKVQSSS